MEVTNSSTGSQLNIGLVWKPNFRVNRCKEETECIANPFKKFVELETGVNLSVYKATSVINAKWLTLLWYCQPASTSSASVEANEICLSNIGSLSGLDQPLALGGPGSPSGLLYAAKLTSCTAACSSLSCPFWAWMNPSHTNTFHGGSWHPRVPDHKTQQSKEVNPSRATHCPVEYKG